MLNRIIILAILLSSCSQGDDAEHHEKKAPISTEIASELDLKLIDASEIQFKGTINQTDDNGLKQGFWIEFRQDSLYDCSVIRTASHQDVDSSITINDSVQYQFNWDAGSKPCCDDCAYLRAGGAPADDFTFAVDSIVYSFTVTQFGMYVDDLRNEIWTFKSGCYKQEINYVDNITSGPFRQYYPTGEIMIEGITNPNQAKQEYKKYFENGEFDTIVGEIPACFPVTY